jgi:hypothetical protein
MNTNRSVAAKNSWKGLSKEERMRRIGYLNVDGKYVPGKRIPIRICATCSAPILVPYRFVREHNFCNRKCRGKFDSIKKKGVPLPEKWRENISIGLKNSKTNKTWKDYWKDPIIRPKLLSTKKAASLKAAEKRKELHKDPIWVSNLSKAVSIGVKKQWQRDREKMLQAIHKGLHKHPNYCEKKTFEFLEELVPGEFYFNGYPNTKKGILVIGDKAIPDFVSTKRNVVVEFFGEHWHKPEEERERIKFMKDNGYECLVLWTKDFNNIDSLKSKVQSFLS